LWMSTLFVLCFYFIPQLHAALICFIFVLLERGIGLSFRNYYERMLSFTRDGCIMLSSISEDWHQRRTNKLHWLAKSQ